jgi:hypothetical protein
MTGMAGAEPLATGPAGTGPVGPDYTRESAAGTAYDANTVGYNSTDSYGATGSLGATDQVVERPVGVGVAEVPVVVTEQERVHTGEWCALLLYCCC